MQSMALDEREVDDPARLAPAVDTVAGRDGVWAPARRRLTLGLVMTITLVAFEALAISTVMPGGPVQLFEPDNNKAEGEA